MLTDSIKEFLDSNHVKYVTLSYSPAYEPREIADSALGSGKEPAKTVLVRLDDKMAMAVLPAGRDVDLDRLRTLSGAKTAQVADDFEFEHLFAACEAGTMPPFGNLYGMEVFADSALEKQKDIAFVACSHNDLVKMDFSDYQRLVSAKTAPISS